MRRDITSAGPACSLATVPMRIYTPAPMVAPTPDFQEQSITFRNVNVREKEAKANKHTLLQQQSLIPLGKVRHMDHTCHSA